ncbi:MAG: ECF transporter S component [Candidatus Caldatribacterium sp.]|uniref:ECF transporter S component n=1 Tax=Candidatus Caldatribacterium sp. TaxID=2282143 RepID=UPI0029985E9B|nr:ECF transporter S component [Candidatus Caldatribacterium sp.]MCX7729936.1 ECF transporter S component [Candidatus Caldatribacterium sp.]MDW8081506.1 ECF transporter S component [Candidatus Calescibacterium sp.]
MEHARTLTYRLSLSASLVALCVVGSFLKIPSPTGTVALDSLPGFLGALLLGYGEGALVAFLGHILTSLNVGFPLGFPIHLLIALEMGGIALFFRLLFTRFGALVALASGTLANGVLAPLSLVPLFGWGFFLGILPSLTLGSLVNIALATVLYQVVSKRWKGIVS